jgi:nitric oxide reductase NorE protein
MTPAPNALRSLRSSSLTPRDEETKSNEEPSPREEATKTNDERLPGQLPGELMMWVLIVSELAVFGAGLLAFLAVRLTDPQGFAEAQFHLHRSGAAANTLVLVTSGWLAALATEAAEAGLTRRLRHLLALAILLGGVFLALKASEYADLFAQGIGTETHAFFTFHLLLTGFHAAHVLAGMVLLALVGWLASPRAVETGAAFWHMVDLVWVLLVPVVYLI